jgi:hypothetical protein
MAPPQGRLFVLRFEKNPDRLTLLSTISLAVGGDVLGYGVCGIAAAELDPQTAGLEVIVTTLNGELIVFDQSAGALTLTHRFSTVVRAGTSRSRQRCSSRANERGPSGRAGRSWPVGEDGFRSNRGRRSKSRHCRLSCTPGTVRRSRREWPKLADAGARQERGERGG